MRLILPLLLINLYYGSSEKRCFNLQMQCTGRIGINVGGVQYTGSLKSLREITNASDVSSAGDFVRENICQGGKWIGDSRSTDHPTLGDIFYPWMQERNFSIYGVSGKGILAGSRTGDYSTTFDTRTTFYEGCNMGLKGLEGTQFTYTDRLLTAYYKAFYTLTFMYGGFSFKPLVRNNTCPGGMGMVVIMDSYTTASYTDIIMGNDLNPTFVVRTFKEWMYISGDTKGSEHHITKISGLTAKNLMSKDVGSAYWACFQGAPIVQSLVVIGSFWPTYKYSYGQGWYPYPENVLEVVAMSGEYVHSYTNISTYTHYREEPKQTRMVFAAQSAACEALPKCVIIDLSGDQTYPGPYSVATNDHGSGFMRQKIKDLFNDTCECKGLWKTKDDLITSDATLLYDTPTCGRKLSQSLANSSIESPPYKIENCYVDYDTLMRTKRSIYEQEQGVPHRVKRAWGFSGVCFGLLVTVCTGESPFVDKENFNKLQDRVDGIFDSFNLKVAEFNDRFNLMDQRFVSLSTQLALLSAQINKAIASINEQFKAVTEYVNVLKDRLLRIEEQTIINMANIDLINNFIETLTRQKAATLENKYTLDADGCIDGDEIDSLTVATVPSVDNITAFGTLSIMNATVYIPPKIVFAGGSDSSSWWVYLIIGLGVLALIIAIICVCKCLC